MSQMTMRPRWLFAVAILATLALGASRGQAEESPREQQPEGKSNPNQAEGVVEERGVPGVLGSSRIIPVPVESQAVGAGTIQNCAGPDTFIQPNGTFPLTCPVNSPLGGHQMLILPEMWVRGNGCIVTVDSRVSWRSGTTKESVRHSKIAVALHTKGLKVVLRG